MRIVKKLIEVILLLLTVISYLFIVVDIGSTYGSLIIFLLWDLFSPFNIIALLGVAGLLIVPIIKSPRKKHLIYLALILCMLQKIIISSIYGIYLEGEFPFSGFSLVIFFAFLSTSYFYIRREQVLNWIKSGAVTVNNN